MFPLFLTLNENSYVTILHLTGEREHGVNVCVCGMHAKRVTIHVLCIISYAQSKPCPCLVHCADTDSYMVMEF